MNKKEVLKLAKGFRGRAKNCIRIARERVEKALQYSYRDRRNKKRDMRSLWIQRINAGTRQHGVCFYPYFPLFICYFAVVFLICLKKVWVGYIGVWFFFEFCTFLHWFFSCFENYEYINSLFHVFDFCDFLALLLKLWVRLWVYLG